MGSLGSITGRLGNALASWRSVQLSAVLFGHLDTAAIALIVLAGGATALALLRAVLRRRRRAGQIALPALLAWTRPSALSPIRHGALLLALAGVPFFMLALADPYLPLQTREVTYPGRRIALMLDASASMVIPFHAAHLNPNGPNEASFLTTVGAAQTFIRQRIRGRYRDLIGLIEFGDEAYVVTPFTSDYDNLLLSLSLVGDWTEYMKFSDQGTTIGQAIGEGVSLFKAFDFLNASGNLLIVLSDGQDRQVIVQGRSIDDILSGAKRANIPVYFIRVGYKKALGDVVPDAIWRPAVEATGGRFYAAADEATILRAIDDIDARSAGTIALKQYTTEQPQFAPFALLAVCLWTAALALKLTVPAFQKFP
jgi:Ca-activated chloride channel homolog